MKFSQIRIGQRFRYNGQVYRKATPLMANPENGEQQRLIPRSAIIELLDGPPPEPESVAPDQIPVARLDPVMAQLAGEINDIIAESGLNAGQVNSILRRLQTAFSKARHNLNLP